NPLRARAHPQDALGFQVRQIAEAGSVVDAAQIVDHVPLRPLRLHPDEPASCFAGFRVAAAEVRSKGMRRGRAGFSWRPFARATSAPTRLRISSRAVPRSDAMRSVVAGPLPLPSCSSTIFATTAMPAPSQSE